ncbi:MAG: heme-binding protein, partial [Phycisphaerales bacterium]
MILGGSAALLGLAGCGGPPNAEGPIALAVMASESGTGEASRTAAREPSESEPVIRVFDAPEGETVLRVGDEWVCGVSRIPTKLPVGYPPPTAIGAIELKWYPSVRRATVEGGGSADWGTNFAFWPLFRHIERNDIAMTSPVEIDYEDVASADDRPSDWRMAFLYEKFSDGPAGEYGRVTVRDAPPVVVLSAGVRGPYRVTNDQQALGALEAWLEQNPEWERVAPPRVLRYNGPEAPAARKWSEVQIPVRLRAVSESGGE